MGTADLGLRALTDELDRLAKHTEEMPPDVAGIEAQIESGLVEPFFEALGYDMRNWRHVRKRYGTEKWGDEKVDYALLGSNGEPVTLVECKSLATRTLDRGAWKQLRRYFNDTGAHIGILTNGETYEIYLDRDDLIGMDEEPFFTFVISDREELALRAVFRLTRLEDGSFDLKGFEEDVAAHRFTTRYKTQALQVFEGWLIRTDEELVRLLEKKLRAPEGSLGELTQEWFTEFVGSHRETGTGCQPPPPHGNIKPLPAWNIHKKKDMPTKIIFPDGTDHLINPAHDVPVTTTKWLIQNGHLTRNSLPIRYAGRYIVSETDTHPNEQSMTSPQEAEWAYVEGNYNPKDHVRNAKIIIEEVGQDPAKFKGQFHDIEARQL